VGLKFKLLLHRLSFTRAFIVDIRRSAVFESPALRHGNLASHRATEISLVGLGRLPSSPLCVEWLSACRMYFS